MKYATPNEADEWATFVPKAQKNDEQKHDVSKDLLSATLDQTTITVRNTADLSFAELGEITRLNDEQTAKHPALLNRFAPEAVMAGDGLIAFATRQGTVIAAIHATRGFDQDVSVLNLGSLVSDGSFSGVSVPLIAALFVGNSHWSGTEVGGSGVARILPDGMVNIGSSKTLMRLAFYGEEVFAHPMTLRNPQKAIAGSAESDNGPLWYLRLKGKASEVADRSREVLEHWSVELGSVETD
jgi:hypothetical protein